MPRKIKQYTVTTKLLPKDHKRLIALRDRTGLTVTAILAKALLEYMDDEDMLDEMDKDMNRVKQAAERSLFDVIHDKKWGHL